MRTLLKSFVLFIGIICICMQFDGEYRSFISFVTGVVFSSWGVFMVIQDRKNQQMTKTIMQMANNLYTSTRQVDAKKIASDLKKDEIYVRRILADLQHKKEIPSIAEII